MIIDEILDRKDWEEEGYDVYNAHDFYTNCMISSTHFNGIGDEITYAMDYLENKDVQEAICHYIINNEYNPQICDYVRSKNWIENGKYNLVRRNGGCMLMKCS